MARLEPGSAAPFNPSFERWQAAVRKVGGGGLPVDGMGPSLVPYTFAGGPLVAGARSGTCPLSKKATRTSQGGESLVRACPTQAQAPTCGACLVAEPVTGAVVP